MKCTSPRTVGFLADGKTLCWSKNKYSKEYAPFQIPCGKCISCRLESARQTAIRCVHEAQMHDDNIFLTLTYNNENLGTNVLDYTHFQTFIKDLRNNIYQELLDSMFPHLVQSEQRRIWNQLPKERRNELYGKIKIGVFAVGEYGTKSGRAHWHALIFNYRPKDSRPKYTSERGDRVYHSESLEKIWSRGITEYGAVTFESAGYCARYSSKKLSHGPDGSHQREPISRRSCRQAIGKSWIEKYHNDVFNNGFIVLPGGQKSSIPRYYEKWYKQKHPLLWMHYIHNLKSKLTKEAQDKEEKITTSEKLQNLERSRRHGLAMTLVKTRKQSENQILEQKFEILNKHQKI